MPPHHVILILGTGLVVGFINNLAGAAGALGLLAFGFLLEMSDIAANASIRPSALAIGLGGLIGFLTKGQRIPPKMWLYALLTIPGAVAGSLLVKPQFTLLFQVTLGALLLMVLVQQFMNTEGAERQGDRKPTPVWLLFLLFTWLGAHMGFIQVATGLVSIFILSLTHSRDLVQVNAAKMAFVIVSSTASIGTLAAHGQIVWRPALILALGAGIGSFLASRWSVRKGHGAVRIIVIAICVVVLIRLLVKMFD